MTIVKKENEFLFDEVKFCLSAISADETRPNMTRLNVLEYEGKAWMICTDGRRLHMSNLSSFHSTPILGLYNFTKTAKEIVLTPVIDYLDPPNFTRVIPDINNLVLLLSNFLSQKEPSLHSQYVFKLYNKGILINLRFLSDLSTTKRYPKEYRVYGNLEKEFTPIVFDGGIRKAVIMGMRHQ